MSAIGPQLPISQTSASGHFQSPSVSPGRSLLTARGGQYGSLLNTNIGETFNADSSDWADPCSQT